MGMIMGVIGMIMGENKNEENNRTMITIGQHNDIDRTIETVMT